MRDMPFEISTAQVAPGQALMTLTGLRYHGKGRALVDVEALTIPADRATVILGANGAGKSLLLRLMHGLLKPSEGAVLWKDAPLNRAARRAQAMVFQRPVLLRRSVRANVAFAVRQAALPRAERAEAERQALVTARLEHLAQTPARLLSGGEQQRLALARALATRPEVLFLDEPTANLDPAATLAIEDQIAAARAAGITVVMVTHDAGQARRVGEHGIFLHAGRVVETASIPQLLDHPQTAPAQAWAEGRLYID